MEHNNAMPNGYYCKIPRSLLIRWPSLILFCRDDIHKITRSFANTTDVFMYKFTVLLLILSLLISWSPTSAASTATTAQRTTTEGQGKIDKINCECSKYNSTVDSFSGQSSIHRDLLRYYVISISCILLTSQGTYLKN